MRALSIDGHDETDTAGLVLVLGIVESLFARCLPWHLLLLLHILLDILILMILMLAAQMQFIRFFKVATVATAGVDFRIFKIEIAANRCCCCCCLNSCTFKFAIVSGCWCHYTLKVSRDLI